MPTPDRPYSLELPAGNGNPDFASRSEVVDWTAKERDFWDFCSDRQPEVSGLYRNMFNTANSSVVDPTGFHAAWPSLKKQIEETYNTAIHRESRRGELVQSLIRTVNEEAAAAAAAYFMGCFKSDRFPRYAQPMLRGILAAHQHAFGSSESVEASSAALEKLYGRMSASANILEASQQESITTRKDLLDTLAQIRTDWIDFLSKGAEKLAAIERGHTEQLDAHTKTEDQRLVTWKEAIDADMTATRKEVAAFKQTLLDEAAVQGSVTYWDRRADDHARWAKVFGVAFVGLTVGAGALAWYQLPHLLPKEELVGIEHLPIGRLALTGIMVTLTLWLLRTVARLFYSNQQLGLDARERVTMVRTYHALMTESKLPVATDRLPMIRAMFRRANTGMVSEEPPQVVNLLKGSDG